MKKQIYSIRDDLTFEFESPFIVFSELDCLRAVSSQVTTELNKYEKGIIDFDPSIQHSTRSLFHIGEFDSASGSITCSEPKVICKLSDAINYYQKLLTDF